MSKPPTFQETVFRLKKYWSDRGCIIQEPYDVEVGAGTMAPETFLRVLGPEPYRVAYVQPSRRPADGRYGENPNRLYKHQQLQVILKPSPADVIDQYLGSLDSHRHRPPQARHQVRRGQLGSAHARRLGHRLAGHAGRPRDHAVHLLPAMRRHRSRPRPRRAHLWTRAHRRPSCKMSTASTTSNGRPASATAQVRFKDERQFSKYNFELADVQMLWQLFDLHEKECQRLLKIHPTWSCPLTIRSSSARTFSICSIRAAPSASPSASASSAASEDSRSASPKRG